MKTKWIGLGIILAVIAAAGIYMAVRQGGTVLEIDGYVGGEKLGLLEDEEVVEILEDDYKLAMDYARVGSIEMVTEDSEGRDFLFPSNQTALELYEQNYGTPVRSEIIFNTPIVLYTRRTVAEALEAAGMVTGRGGVLYADMSQLTQCIEDGVQWADIGLPQLAMHSSYETAGCRDADLMIEALTVFYGASVEAEEDGRFYLTLPRPKPEAL